MSDTTPSLPGKPIATTQEVSKHFFTTYIRQITHKVFAKPFGELAKFYDLVIELPLNARTAYAA